VIKSTQVTQVLEEDVDVRQLADYLSKPQPQW